MTASLGSSAACGAMVSPSWRTAQDEAGFAAIFEDAVNLVVWSRAGTPLPDVARLIDRPPRRLMRAIRTQTISPDAVSHALDLDICPSETGFATDLARLIELFATLTDAESVGIRLEATDRQTCPKWHTDSVGLRLMTTYAGPGTEWLDGAATRRASTGDVLVAKGELWPSAPGACVHRSPDPQGATRLLLTLDELR